MRSEKEIRELLDWLREERTRENFPGLKFEKEAKEPASVPNPGWIENVRQAINDLEWVLS